MEGGQADEGHSRSVNCRSVLSDSWKLEIFRPLLTKACPRLAGSILRFLCLCHSFIKLTLFSSSGGASTSSAEAIGLNLQRAIKAAGLSKTDIANVMRVGDTIITDFNVILTC